MPLDSMLNPPSPPTPFATLELGVNKTTGLNQRLVVWDIFISSKQECVRVFYTIQDISPTGIVLKETEPAYYERINTDTNKKFDELRNSGTGETIIGMIKFDLKNYPDLDQK